MFSITTQVVTFFLFNICPYFPILLREFCCCFRENCFDNKVFKGLFFDNNIFKEIFSITTQKVDFFLFNPCPYFPCPFPGIVDFCPWHAFACPSITTRLANLIETSCQFASQISTR